VSTPVILATGVAGLLAGALSMGAGEFVSVRSQRELLQASNPDPDADTALPYLDVDANELSLVYRARGMSPEQSTEHANDVLRDLSVRHSTYEVRDPDQVGSATGAAISSFLFFASGAIIPVLPYLFGAEGILAVVLSSILVGLALLATGAVVGLLSGGPPLARALRQLAIGFGAAGATYLLGLLFGTTMA
jgi:VIT1/CCC1 family predicted Fe2+/Mn2+ transporter